ncbi:MAG TPA: PAS domain-containing protein, partial [Caulobacteraceae bacterium]|nr:PAS domain-containing protein [Caulobacteraceae bacterium]
FTSSINAFVDPKLHNFVDAPDVDPFGFPLVIHPDDVDEVSAMWRRRIRTGESGKADYRLRLADGSYRWFRTLVRPVRDDAGRITEWRGLAVDVDDQKRLEAALRERGRELSLLVDMVPSHVWRLAPDGEPTFFNRRMVDFLGSDVENIVGPDGKRLEAMIAATVHPQDAGAFSAALDHSLATGEVFLQEYRLRRADGVYRWMASRAEPMRDSAGQIVHWYGLCHDIDDQVQAAEALRRASDKLAQATQAANLAELSASIAHEVNQPLAAIVANSHACHRWLSADPPNLERAKTTAEWITRDANGAADVVSRIRALFRQAPGARPSDDVNRLISETCQLMSDEAAAKGARVEMQLEPDLPPVALDRVQMQQVLVNLIRNGIEAMDGVADRTRALQVRSAREGYAAIRVEVRDAGPGFAAPERALEPFFTTKSAGMGMGLAICRSIIESHGGRLWTAANAPHGALVAFSVPLTPAEMTGRGDQAAGVGTP